MIEIFYNKIKDLDETIVDNEFLLKRIKPHSFLMLPME